MRTTVELPDDLLQRARIEAARRGLALKDLIQDGLRQVLASASAPPCDDAGEPRSLFALMEDGAGIVDSGVPDLGSNPEHT